MDRVHHLRFQHLRSYHRSYQLTMVDVVIAAALSLLLLILLSSDRGNEETTAPPSEALSITKLSLWREVCRNREVLTVSCGSYPYEYDGTRSRPQPLGSSLCQRNKAVAIIGTKTKTARYSCSNCGQLVCVCCYLKKTCRRSWFLSSRLFESAVVDCVETHLRSSPKGFPFLRAM